MGDMRKEFSRQKLKRKRLVDAEDVEILEEMAQDVWDITNEALEEDADGCDCCGSRRYHNYCEKLIANKMRALAERLLEMSKQLKSHIENGHPSEKEEE